MKEKNILSPALTLPASIWRDFEEMVFALPVPSCRPKIKRSY